MGRILRRLRASLAKERIHGTEALARLSSEFRIFLGLFAGINCCAMVPREFLAYPVSPGEEAAGPLLCDFFRRCDLLRFSGKEVVRAEALGLVDEAGTFVNALGAAFRSVPETSLQGNYSGIGGAR
jgi:hypothetical protein